jgi:hypothetical protein
LDEDEIETERKGTNYRLSLIKSGGGGDYDDDNAADIEDGDLIETDVR